MNEIETTDRYKATGTPYPDPETMCNGQCEGMGSYPTEKALINQEACEAKGGRLIVIGQREEDGTPCKEDDWIFVVCPDCNGTGRRK